MHFVTHCTEVSVHKLCPSSSPIPQNQLIQIINDASRLVAGGGMKGRLRGPYPTACWRWQMHQKLLPKKTWLQRLLSPSLMPPSAKLRVKLTISELWRNFSMTHCCILGALWARVGCMPGQGASHAAPEEFFTGDLHPAGVIGAMTMGETLSP